MKKTTSAYILVRKSRIHGTGVFAKKNIPSGAKIIEYVGERVTKKESDRRAQKPLNNNAENEELGAVYLFELTKRHDIDGYFSYNTARYINHSCEPNAEAEIIKGRIWIIAIKDIKKGEEIYYNYGYSWEDYEDHHCCCSSKNCIGFILAEEHWPKLKRKKTLANKKRLAKAALKKSQKKAFQTSRHN